MTPLLFERSINIEDLDQAVRDDLFRMTMRVDTSEMGTTREVVREDLQALATELGVDIQIRVPADRETSRIAVLVTKTSHCLEATEDGDLGAEVSIVIGNHDTLRPLAETHDVPFHDIGDPKETPDEDELLRLLAAYDVDLVVLARYMRILSPEVVFRYQIRIINVHPSLLPAFPGAEAYRQAIEEGVRIVGVTAHYVTIDLDQGPIITQRAFTRMQALRPTPKEHRSPRSGQEAQSGGEIASPEISDCWCVNESRSDSSTPSSSHSRAVQPIRRPTPRNDYSLAGLTPRGLNGVASRSRPKRCPPQSNCISPTPSASTAAGSGLATPTP